jgi:tetratricopeptide (TPR) repeat protein
MSSLFDALGPAGKYPEIVRHLNEISHRPAEPELLNPWLECMVNATGYLAQGGVHQERERTLVLLEESKDKLEPLLIGRAETLKAHLARIAGKPSGCVARFAGAAKHYEGIGNRRAECETSANLAQALVEVGQLEEAEASMRHHLELARRLDLKAMVSGMLTNLILVLAYRGQLDEARDMGKQALAMNRAQGSLYFLAGAEAYLSVTEWLAGDYAAAERHAKAAAAGWDSMATSKPFALALLSRALLRQGRESESLAHAREAYEGFKKLGALDEGEPTVRLALAESLLQTGDQAGAREVLAKAAQSLMESANTMEEPLARQAFLTRRPDHRRILELCNEIGCGLG